MYVRDCWNAFRTIADDLIEDTERAVKKVFCAGPLGWNARDGAALTIDLEAFEMVDVSLNGCRIEKAMTWVLGLVRTQLR